jgi:pseudaminic acid synthase
MFPKFLKNKNKTYFVAEISANHSGKLSNALEMIEKAANAGASAIKFQAYKPESMTLNSKKKYFYIKDKKSLWKNENLFELYSKGRTPYSWFEKLFNFAKKKKITAFSSVFDEDGVDFLESVGNPIYKISSLENNYYPLLKKVSKTKKPLIISLGLTRLDETKDIVKYVKSHGCKELVLLKCTSVYPANLEDLNLETIRDLKKKFNCGVGFSDHTQGLIAPLVASILGANLIEKHFTLKKIRKSLDKEFSINEYQLKNLIDQINKAKNAIGKINYNLSSKEIKRLDRKRSIFTKKNIDKGEIFTKNNLAIIRPGNGLSPKFFENIIGKKSKRKISQASPIKSKDISGFNN